MVWTRGLGGIDTPRVILFARDANDRSPVKAVLEKRPSKAGESARQIVMPCLHPTDTVV